MKNIHYVGLDQNSMADFVNLGGDIANTPIKSATVDAVICIHVLEHVPDDRAAMREMYRILKPGGWAFVTVPLLLEDPTREDPTITAPEERERLFGEKGHVRYYGMDVIDRLENAGFTVDFDPASDIPNNVCKRYGLRRDENILFCNKPN